MFWASISAWRTVSNSTINGLPDDGSMPEAP
jgi:hypothetical protein